MGQAAASPAPYSLEALEEFTDLFDVEICCQDHVIFRMLPQLERRIQAHHGRRTPKQPLLFGMVGGTGTGKTHTLHQLAQTVFRGMTFNRIMSPLMTAHDGRQLVADIKLQVKNQPRSLIVIEELHLAPVRALEFFRKVVKVVAGGQIGGVDFRKATFAFTLNSPDTSARLAEVLFTRKMELGLSGPKAIAGLRYKDWGPDVEALFRKVNKPELGFVLQADVLIPFWPLDNECIACAARRQFAAIAKTQAKEKRMKRLSIDPALFEQIAECQSRDHAAWGGLFPTFGAKHVETTLGACLNAIGSRYNPASKGWFRTTYEWSDKYVDVSAQDPTNRNSAKCKDARRIKMCRALARGFKFQHRRRSDL